MRVVVPFAVETPKTRLGDVLDADERADFAAAMLADVLAAIRATGNEPAVLATAPVEVDAPVSVDDRALTEAVNAALAATDGPVAVVVADLAIATPAALERLFTAGGDGGGDGSTADVAIAPGRAGGTNGLVVRHPDFRVDYHGASYLDHRRIADSIGAEVAVVDSHRLATDVDTRADLVEVLLHGEGRALEWLEDAGFELAVEGGRVDVRRA